MANYDGSTQRRPTTRPSFPSSLLTILSLLLLCCRCLVYGESNEDFNPYQLNGGLVAAVAGRDYVLIATDTRMTGETGYDILHRRHVQSRLWTAAVTATITATTTTTAATPPPVSSERKEDNMTMTTRKNVVQQVLGSDGSLLLPDDEDDGAGGVGSSAITTTATSTTRGGFPRWMIGSAGCSADCEALKRTIRAEMRVWQAHHPPQQQDCDNNDVASMAILLSQVLYGRRGFPFYSFCVLAGLSSTTSSSRGCVYAYDAIGSFEQVPVASSGTGRSLLQPILDGQFASLSSSLSKPVSAGTSSGQAPSDDDESNSKESSDSETALKKYQQQNEDDMIVEQEAEEENGLVVECSAEEASRILVQAYRAVSEREIGVGDYVVICCLRRRPRKDDNMENEQEVECQIQVEPLKRH